MLRSIAFNVPHGGIIAGVAFRCKEFCVAGHFIRHDVDTVDFTTGGMNCFCCSFFRSSTKLAIAFFSSSASRLNAGIILLPLLINETNCSSLYFLFTSISVGVLPLPFYHRRDKSYRFVYIFAALPADSFFFILGNSGLLSTICCTLTISLALIYIIPVAGSNAGPPHSAPPS